MNSKANKIVLITGATSGIGKQTAKLFIKKGYTVIITGRRKEVLDELKHKWEVKYGSEVYTLCFDVMDLDAVKQAIESLPEDLKNVDILINNAGGARGLEPIQEGRFEHWNYMIDANIKGLLYMTRLIAPSMIERKNGHIINISSTAGHEVYANGGVYCAAKHAVSALTKGMRYDMYKHGIRVSQVSPGLVEDTDFAINRFEGDADKANIYSDVSPLKAKDIAELIYFIATRPPHVNIQDILVMCTQQASATQVNRIGRVYDKD